MNKCKYCNFDETVSCFPAKGFETIHYESEEAIHAIGGGLQLDNGNEPSLGVWVIAPKIGYNHSWSIKYCPMCGRKLEE